MIELEINYQVKMPLNWRGFLNKLAQITLSQLKIKKSLNISLAFVSPSVIKKFNKSYRGKDKITDVLSFPEVNEILICYSQAVSSAKRLKITPKREVGFLFVHGLLHLLGYTHQTQRKFNQIIKIQNKVLEEFYS